MASQIVHSVFISSTFEDLRMERAEVQKTFLKLRCFPMGMELFPSADEEAWSYIRRQIEDVDYYVLIVGGRYGSLDKDGISFTEKEYRLAKELNKPCIAFIRRNTESLSDDRRDSDSWKQQQLARFIGDLRGASLLSFFDTPHELALEVMGSFLSLRDRRPTTGYVRSDHSIDPSKYADVLEENKRLAERIHQLEAQLESIGRQRDEPFDGHDLQLSLAIHSGIMGKMPHWNVHATLGQVFSWTVDGIAKTENTTIMRIEIAGSLTGIQVTWTDPSSPRPWLGDAAFVNIKDMLFKRGLITLHHGESDYWSVTDFGIRQYAILSELRSRRIG